MATSTPASSGRNEEVDFRGEKRRSNQTHASTTDPDARLYRKRSGMEAKLSFIGHALMENRNGLFVAARLTNVSGHAERTGRSDMDRALSRQSHFDHAGRRQGLRCR